VPALLALILVTAIWGVTFVQIKDALELYPLFAFLTVRFAIAVAVLAVPAAPRLRSLGGRGAVAGTALGGLLAAGYALQTGRARADDGLRGGLRHRNVRRADAGVRARALSYSP
jgi:drug/metabolite transporter (DMT)-like permease